jgi:hypothetical protein
VGFSVYPPVIARQLLGKHVPMVKEELEASFSMQSLAYQKISPISFLSV